MVEQGDHALGKRFSAILNGLSSATGRRCAATSGAHCRNGHMKGFSSDSIWYCKRSRCRSRSTREVMDRLPAVVPCLLYRHQARYLVRQLGKVRVSGRIAPSAAP